MVQFAEVARTSGRREIRKEKRREAIVMVATRCFLENGYDGTTMSLVFNEIGGSRSTLYSYFRSKDELFAAVIEEALEAYRQDFQSILVPSADLEETLRSFSAHFIARIVSPEAVGLHRLILDVSRRLPHLGALFYERGPKTTRALMATFLAYHIERGELRCKDPHAAATLFNSLCMGGLCQRVLWGAETATEASIEAEARAIARMFLDAYA